MARGKTSVIEFGKNFNTMENQSIHRQELVPVPRIKFLGLFVDNNIEWFDHIEDLSKKLKQL